MAAYKFYSQYALKTNDGTAYLESYEDRVAFNALYFADGDEELALALADEMIYQRYQPATPSFLNAGRKRRGELVSCFLIQLTDDMNAIGRGSIPHCNFLESAAAWESRCLTYGKLVRQSKATKALPVV